MGELQKITAHRRAEPDAVSFPAGLDDMLVRLFFWTIATIVSFAPASASGQGSATQPRASDGKPDLSGVWQVLNTAAWDIQDHNGRLGVPAGEGVAEGNEIPYQPWALQKKSDNFANRATADPESRCFLPGVPRVTYMPFPFQILQAPNQVLIVYEYVHAVRRIYMNGSPHPRGPIQWWMGDSRGRWEGDTLVVDVVHFTDQTWFDRAGNFHSAALHIVERYTPVTPDHIRYDVTVEDPKVFTRPWNMSMLLYRRKEPRARILEYECYSYALDEQGLLPDPVAPSDNRR